jgi:hypothetical protein
MLYLLTAVVAILLLPTQDARWMTPNPTTLVRPSQVLAHDDDRVARQHDCQSKSGALPAVTVHGMLGIANGGGSGYRIWLVGTRRVVWLTDGIPRSIESLFTPAEEHVFGDFTLIPLAPDRPGHMRPMCFVAGENLVLQDPRTGQSKRVKPR